VNLTTGKTVDLQPTNANFGDVDTNVFDNDTLLIPVDPTKLGMAATATSFPVTYQVSTLSGYTGATIDASKAIAYDVADPALVVGSPLYLDKGGVSIPYTLGSDATTRTQALVLHLQGAPGHRAEVLSVTSTKTAPTKPGKQAASTAKWKQSSSHWITKAGANG
jgi:hypothetical protein